MVTVKVVPGVCGLNSTIQASSDDMQTAVLHIESDCPDVRAMAEEIKELDAMAQVFGKVGETPVYKAGAKYLRHAACPVPCALTKAVEAAAGLALPKDVSISITKD